MRKILLVVSLLFLSAACSPSENSGQTASAETQANRPVTPIPTSTPAYTQADYLSDAENLLLDWSNAYSEFNEFLQNRQNNEEDPEWKTSFVEKVSKMQKAGEELGKLTPPTEALDQLDQDLKTLSYEIGVYVIAENGYWLDKNTNQNDIALQHLETIVELQLSIMDEINSMK